MSTLYRLRFLDLSITWWVILALNGLAAGCGGHNTTGLPDVRRERIRLSQQESGTHLTETADQFDSDPRWLPVP